MMMRGSKKSMVAADRSKIGRTGFTRVRDNLDKICLVTDGGEAEHLTALAEMGVRIVTP